MNLDWMSTMKLQTPAIVRNLTIILLLLVCTQACVVNPIANQPDPQALSLPDFEELLPDSNPFEFSPTQPASGSFISTLNSYGIRLSNAELNSLKRLLNLQPTGQWARTRTQTAEQVLNANFRRFGSLFQPPPADAEEYRQRALAFAQKKNIPYFLDLQYYLDTRQLLVVRWDEKTGEFITLQPDGSLINYLISMAVKSNRYLRIEL